jgi:hypothetical protein
MVTARVDGFVSMQHVFYPGRTDAQPLEAEVVGVLTFEPGKPPSLQLTTTKRFTDSGRSRWLSGRCRRRLNRRLRHRQVRGSYS